jgi:hypothetical protein
VTLKGVAGLDCQPDVLAMLWGEHWRDVTIFGATSERSMNWVSPDVW